MTFLSSSKLDKAIQKSLVEWLSPLGFKKESNGGCGRAQGDTYTYIACVVNKIGGTNRVRPFGQMGFFHRKRIYSAFMSDNQAESNKIAVDLQADYAHFKQDWTADMRCEQQEQLEPFLAELKDFVLNKLYPLITAYPEPSQVLDLYLKYDETNRQNFALPGWSGYSSALGALILARLHAPGSYRDLKHRYALVLSGLPPEHKERCSQLIAYLDQETLPPLHSGVGAP